MLMAASEVRTHAFWVAMSCVSTEYLFVLVLLCLEWQTNILVIKFFFLCLNFVLLTKHPWTLTTQMTFKIPYLGSAVTQTERTNAITTGLLYIEVFFKTELVAVFKFNIYVFYKHKCQTAKDHLSHWV
jgi:hypothetical protein